MSHPGLTSEERHANITVLEMVLGYQFGEWTEAMRVISDSRVT